MFELSPPGPFVEAVERATDGEDGATLDGEACAGRLPDHLGAAQLGLSREPFQVLQDPAARCHRAGTEHRHAAGRGHLGQFGGVPARDERVRQQHEVVLEIVERLTGHADAVGVGVRPRSSWAWAPR